MIGVLADDGDMPWVEEFFELFKTPWERAVQGRDYSVVLSTDGCDVDVPGELTLIYGSAEVPLDRRLSVIMARPAEPVWINFGGDAFPAYGPVATFVHDSEPLLSTEGRAVDYRVSCGPKTILRVGYDLFREVAHLLTRGQPASSAPYATLDLHIAFLRGAIESARVPYVEIPPRPHGAEFVCCLTHDIDFFGIRRHRLDGTMAGFLARSTVGTLADVAKRRRTLAEGIRNFAAVLSLPLVFLGFVRDFWSPLDDYAVADRGLPSTFFIVPFKARPGVSPDGRINPRRAVKYAAQDISQQLRAASTTAREVAVHGIDAWRDAALGRLERAEVAAAADNWSNGVRMHWLYFSDASPQAIEQAGFEYDSTCGYNDTIGYRAGTMQPFRLHGSQNVLELPMAVMDTAMFYPDYMNLDRSQALERLRTIVADAERFGGALVVNWHDRSLVPERQWQRAYASLLDELQAKRVWFATAADAARWFKWRRGVRFGSGATAGEVVVECPPAPADLPPLRLVSRRSGTQVPGVEEHALPSGTTVVM